MASLLFKSAIGESSLLLNRFIVAFLCLIDSTNIVFPSVKYLQDRIGQRATFSRVTLSKFQVIAGVNVHGCSSNILPHQSLYATFSFMSQLSLRAPSKVCRREVRVAGHNVWLGLREICDDAFRQLQMILNNLRWGQAKPLIDAYIIVDAVLQHLEIDHRNIAGVLDIVCVW